MINRDHWVNCRVHQQIDMVSIYSAYLINKGEMTFESFSSNISRFLQYNVIRSNVLKDTAAILDHHFELKVLSQGNSIIGMW